MADNEELLPCPFCGKVAVLDPFNEADGEYYVYCSGHVGDQCKCDLGIYDTKAEAIAAWNRRASPTTSPHAPEGVRDDVLDVLRNLTNSADGLSFREDAIRNIVGNTNWRILRDHIAAARAILPAAPTSTESRE